MTAKTCSQHKCNEPAMFRYTWPGKDESFVCGIHATGLMNVANAMGFYLQLILIDNDGEDLP